MTTQDKFTSAIVRVNPEGEEVYSALRDETQRLGELALAFVVNSPDTVREATEDLVTVATLRKTLESLRKEYVDPLNAHVKAINDAFKPLTDTISEANTILKGKIALYNTEQQRIKAEAERIERLRLEAEEAAAKLALEAGQPPPPPPEPVAPLPQSQEQRRVDTVVGGMHTRQIPKWELLDFEQVPSKYKVLDSVKIGKLVRAGEREIPGIRIWLEDEISVVPKSASFMGPRKGESPIPVAPAIDGVKPSGDIPF